MTPAKEKASAVFTMPAPWFTPALIDHALRLDDLPAYAMLVVEGGLRKNGLAVPEKSSESNTKTP